MKHSIFATPAVWVLVCAVSLLMTGCINEYLDECHRLTLKVVNDNGQDVTEGGDVTEASLYVFDEADKYLQTIRMTEAEIKGRTAIALDYPAGRNLQIIAWGNLGGQRQDVNEGQLIDQLTVMLKSQDGLADSPDHIFYGNLDVKTGLGDGPDKNDTIVIRPKTSQIHITTIGMEYRLKKQLPMSNMMRAVQDLDCHYYVNRTLSGYDHRGILIGDSVYYDPQTQWTENNEFVASNYNMCSGVNMSVDLVADNQLLVTATQDYKGDPITIPEGKQLQVVIEFAEDGSLLSVRQRIRPWGTVDVNIDF